jgi:Protein of unknown function (DUF2892)
MDANIGTVDRVLRIVLGLVLLSMLLWADGAIRWVGLVGLVPLGTALIRWCPLYTALHIKT